MSESLCILSRTGKLRLVLRSHDMGGVDYETVMALTPQTAAILALSGTGIYWVHDPIDGLPEVPEGARVVFLPSLFADDSWNLAVCVHDTILAETPMDPYMASRANARIAQCTTFPGRSLVDARHAQAQRLIQEADGLRAKADTLVAKANELLVDIDTVETESHAA